MPSLGRHATPRGRVKDILDRLVPGERRNTQANLFITKRTDDLFAAKAAKLGVSKAGLFGLVLESVARGNLFDAVLDLPDDLPVRPALKRNDEIRVS